METVWLAPCFRHVERAAAVFLDVQLKALGDSPSASPRMAHIIDILERWALFEVFEPLFVHLLCDLSEAHLLRPIHALDGSTTEPTVAFTVSLYARMVQWLHPLPGWFADLAVGDRWLAQLEAYCVGCIVATRCVCHRDGLSGDFTHACRLDVLFDMIHYYPISKHFAVQDLQACIQMSDFKSAAFERCMHRCAFMHCKYWCLHSDAV